MPLRPGPHNASIRARAAAWIVCAKRRREEEEKREDGGKIITQKLEKLEAN